MRMPALPQPKHKVKTKISLWKAFRKIVVKKIEKKA